MGKIAYIYGGQGMQVEKMGYDFYKEYEEVRNFYDQICLRFDLKEYSFSKDLKTISNTRYTQAIIIAYELAVTKLVDKFIKPDYLIGLSIGEYACLNRAKVLSDKDVLKIADYRGEFMADACQNIDTGMVAILKTDRKIIEKVIENTQTAFPLEIANINSKDQIVVGGEKTSLDELVKNLKKEGVKRLIPLKVSSAFHTSYMASAGEKLEEFFKGIDFKDQKLPIAWNRLGKVENHLDIEKLMVEQIQKPVLLYPGILDLLNKGVDTFIEIGTNEVMKKLLAKIDPSLKIYSIGSVKDYKKLRGDLA